MKNTREEYESVWVAKDQHRLIRDCICLALCVVAVVVVTFSLSMVILGSSRGYYDVKFMLARVKNASAVDFTVTFDFNDQHHPSRPRSKRNSTMFEISNIKGRLYPRISEDTGHLCFDGDIDITTMVGKNYSILLQNHRGIRTVKSQTSGVVENPECLFVHDFLPLHAIDFVASTAFASKITESFPVNCTNSHMIELIFARRPYAFCSLEAVVGIDVFLNDLKHNALHMAAPESVQIFGERVIVDAVLHSESVVREKEGNASIPMRCDYLDAPLTTGREQNIIWKDFLFPHIG